MAGLDNDVFAGARDLIDTRQNVSAKRLHEPAPTSAELHALLRLAAAAPDHGMLTPWRFVVIPVGQRCRLAKAFALALSDRDPAATPDQVQAARDKAHRAPLLLVAIACLGPREPDIPTLERLVSLGAAIQNLLLGAHAMGYGAGLTSGQAMSSVRMRGLLHLADGEEAVCCINIGTVSTSKQPSRVRPLPAAFVSALGAGPA